METISDRMTPLLKCMVLFLFVFTAKVLTSRPNESQDTNGIHQSKPAYYVRTFTKYHHRRTIQWNNQNPDYQLWTADHPKVIQKRSLDDRDLIENSDSNVRGSVIKQNTDSHELLINTPDVISLKKRTAISSGKNSGNQLSHNTPENGQLSIVKRNTDSHELLENTLDLVSFEKTAISSGKDNGNRLSNDVSKYRVKPAYIPTDAPTTIGPTISCLYKTNKVAMSVTPSYNDEGKAQLMVENEGFDNGPLSEVTMPSGEVVQVEQCMDPRAHCYTLWHQDDGGNITVLGQGCWRGSPDGVGCGRCTRVTPRLPATKFCCCTQARCNHDFTSLQEETVAMKAEAPADAAPRARHSGAAAAAAALALLALLALAAALLALRRRAAPPPPPPDDTEKGDVMGSGPDALATGLLCVDNVTLLEHIGQGKFGSVWRGSLGSTPVAVKLYSNAGAWQKEAAIYGLPHLSHPNILRYYGSDARPPLGGSAGSRLLVLELCACTLRARLQGSALTWPQYAALAHGMAAALAHLHTPSGSKPCVVHRDVNSNNVLVAADGTARLADLGLAQPLAPRPARDPPSRITEAGTLRYLAPEALDGALDLVGARAALCAVDVFALGLVLWEALWRCRGAHAGAAPPYALPYQHHGLAANPTLAMMQSLVSRNKARPPLPPPPATSPAAARALRLAADTCDECWDHDAEARLTAVCVEERMAELRQMVAAHGPLIHDNNLHPNGPDTASSPPDDKNSNCLAACDVTAPLLLPPPLTGRNACLARNTHTDTHTNTQLVHKSLKDITEPVETPRPVEENCLSVARLTARVVHENSERQEQARSYQRPLEYVPNDVSCVDVDRGPKQTNLLNGRVDKPKWGIRKFFEKNVSRNKHETEVKLVPDNSSVTRTSIVDKKSNINYDRPSNLILNQDRYFEIPCTLSPPNRTLSPTMMMESDLNRENNVFAFKELPSTDENKAQNQIFAVIVPKAKPDYFDNKTNSSDSMKNSVQTSISSHSILKAAHSESEDCTHRKNGSASSSRASINLELQYIEHPTEFNTSFDLNSDCSSSEDEHLMLLSEGSKITMQTVKADDKRKYQNDVLKESTQTKPDFVFNKLNKYSNFDNEYSDPNDKENVNFSADNPVYVAAFEKGAESLPKSPKQCAKPITRQASLEQVSGLFCAEGAAGGGRLRPAAGRVPTPGHAPRPHRRRLRRPCRLSLYDDTVMFGHTL